MCLSTLVTTPLLWVDTSVRTIHFGSLRSLNSNRLGIYSREAEKARFMSRVSAALAFEPTDQRNHYLRGRV
jgi:hypothetical protein